MTACMHGQRRASQPHTLLAKAPSQFVAATATCTSSAPTGLPLLVACRRTLRDDSWRESLTTPSTRVVRATKHSMAALRTSQAGQGRARRHTCARGRVGWGGGSTYWVVAAGKAGGCMHVYTWYGTDDVGLDTHNAMQGAWVARCHARAWTGAEGWSCPHKHAYIRQSSPVGRIHGRADRRQAGRQSVRAAPAQVLYLIADC